MAGESPLLLLGYISQYSEYIDPARWCVVVGFPSPGYAAVAKGTGVHRLKGDISWVQNVVRQFGRYLQEVSAV